MNKRQAQELELQTLMPPEAFKTFIYFISNILSKFSVHPNDVEDLTMETVLGILTDLNGGRYPANVSEYINNITIQTLHNYERKRNTLKRGGDKVETNLDAGFWTTIYDTSEDQNPVRTAAITEAIGILPSDSREIIRLHVAEGVSLAEIAKILGLRQKAVEDKLRKAQVILKEAFEPSETTPSIIKVDIDKLTDIISRIRSQSDERLNRLAPPTPDTPAPWSNALDALMVNVTHEVGYEALTRGLFALSHDFRQSVGARLEPSFNAYVHTITRENVDQKKALCEFVNGELERLGLAVQDPNTKLPAKLKATSGNRAEVGTFYFEVYEGGKRKTPTWSDALPKLTLIDATPAIGVDGHWQNVVGPKTNRRGIRRGE